MPFPVVIVSLSDTSFNQFIAPNLKDKQWSFDLVRIDPQLGDTALLQAINQNKAQVLITGWGSPTLPKNILEQAPDLRYICHTTGSIRHMIDRSQIVQGLLVTNYGTHVGPIVAEHCLMQILACLRNATYYQLHMHTEAGWGEAARFPPRSLYGRRVGLHGFGANARALVKLLQPFECKISAYAPGDPEETLEQLYVSRCDTLEELFSSNEILVELAPWIPETVGVINEHLLQLIPEGGILVNSGRAAVINEAALLKVAQQGKINIALDVYHQEPLAPDSLLRGLTNVFLSPHMAGPTQDHYSELGRFALRNVERYYQHLPLQALIDPYRYDHQT